MRLLRTGTTVRHLSFARLLLAPWIVRSYLCTLSVFSGNFCFIAEISRDTTPAQLGLAMLVPIMSCFFCNVQFGTGAMAPPGAMMLTPTNDTCSMNYSLNVSLCRKNYIEKLCTSLSYSEKFVHSRQQNQLTLRVVFKREVFYRGVPKQASGGHLEEKRRTNASLATNFTRAFNPSPFRCGAMWWHCAFDGLITRVSIRGRPCAGPRKFTALQVLSHRKGRRHQAWAPAPRRTNKIV